MSLTPEQIEAYLGNEGELCPWCRSDELLAAGELEQDATVCWQNVMCLRCRKEWVDKYELVSISEVDDE